MLDDSKGAGRAQATGTCLPHVTTCLPVSETLTKPIGYMRRELAVTALGMKSFESDEAFSSLISSWAAKITSQTRIAF